MKRISAAIPKIAVVLLSLAALHASALPAVKINQTDAGTCRMDTDGKRWSCVYAAVLRDASSAGKELALSPGGWKKHPSSGHITGYNGDITLRIKAPGPIAKITLDGAITNYADSRKRTAYAAFSLDGVIFRELARQEFASGTAKLKGSFQLPPGDAEYIWVRFGRQLEDGDANGKYGFVLFNRIGFQLEGVMKDEQKSDVDEKRAQTPALKEFFPTGVFWPWERTKTNAEGAGMELWAFVESQMKQLREHGCNTVWFVNLPEGNMPKILLLAEKYGLKVLLNSGLIEAFYHDAGSLSRLKWIAENTVRRIGEFPALLGYVLKDEPLLCSVESCNYFYELMKKADPGRDSLVVAMNRQSVTFLRESRLPVVCTDIYYFGHDRSTNLPNPAAVSQKEFTDGLDAYNQVAEQSGKHSWFMGQMFGDVWGRHHLSGGKCIVEPGSYLHWRMPTAAETRWQIWEALRNGSKGIFFYVLLPPKPLTIPPDQVKPGTPEARMVAGMDANAKTAASWKRQELTKKRMTIDPGAGAIQYGGKPTEQMRAMGKVFQLLRAHEKLLLARRRAAFPVFFPAHADADAATFETGDDRRYGIVVNRNLNEKRDLEILLPANVRAVENLTGGTALPVAKKNADFRSIVLTLEPGDGALLAASFVNDVPGMPVCRESFGQTSMFRVNLNSNAEVFTHGNFGADVHRSVRLKGEPSKPVFTLENLTNRKSAQNTFTMNLNKEKRDGTVYCLLNGKLSSAVVKSVSTRSSGEKTNVNYLADENFRSAKREARGTRNNVVQERDYRIPAVVPAGTTSLEFYLNSRSDFISDVTVWFIPKVK